MYNVLSDELDGDGSVDGKEDGAVVAVINEDADNDDDDTIIDEAVPDGPAEEATACWSNIWART